MTRHCAIGPYACGPAHDLVVIAGPCVIESLALGQTIGRELKRICDAIGAQLVFKGSFDKANRTNVDSPRGPGIEQGLEWLVAVGKELGVPITTDVHEPAQCERVARDIDLLQLPAFLCRQTDLVVAAAEACATHNRALNIKKGQFLSPAELDGPIEKARRAGCENVMVTDRGTFFGYGRLVNDFIGLGEMLSADHGAAVCLDATHSTQRPGLGDGGKMSGGAPEMAPLLARAGAAAGIDALFIECHPDPANALSDKATMLPLAVVEKTLTDVAAIRRAIA